VNLLNIADYAKAAKASCPEALLAYINSGSEDEITVAANRSAFLKWRFKPPVLSGCVDIDLSMNLFGQQLASPIILAPVGCQGLIHPDGELASVRAADATQCVMTVSTMSTFSIEDIAAQSHAQHWFQLYCMKDHELTLSLIRRAELAGYRCLVVTVDTPRLGRREKSIRSPLSVKTDLTIGNFSKQTLHHTNLSSFLAIVEQLFDSAINWQTIAWVKNQTKLPLLLKGILTQEDAEQAIAHGVDGIIVSNHGGRQLDGAIASLDSLAEITKIVAGRCKILFDGGIRRGTDVLKARALGADAILIGRPFLWGLALKGCEGVKQVINLLKDELEHAMFLCGQSSWSQVDSSLVALNYPQQPWRYYADIKEFC